MPSLVEIGYSCSGEENENVKVYDNNNDDRQWTFGSGELKNNRVFNNRTN